MMYVVLFMIYQNRNDVFKFFVIQQAATCMHSRLTALFQYNLSYPVPEGQTILDFTEARDDGEAVASAGPYANNLHLAPDR